MSQYYCGFGDKFCGQSTEDDVNPGTKLVILAFLNTKADGSVIMDEDNFPHGPFKIWKSHGQKVLVSVGGQNGNWGYVFASKQNIDNFVNSLVDIVKRFKLDGVDLDIENYNTPPRTVANTIIQLKTALLELGGKKLLTASHECVCVYQPMAVPDPDSGAGYYNYFVPIINLADKYIDYYQPQAYNNWYEFPNGSVEFLQDVYLNWRNFQGMTPWGSKPLPNFSGIAPEKFLMGILASRKAGGPDYYYTPEVIAKFKEWLKQKGYTIGGFMMWDSHWDTENGRECSNACLKD